MQLERFIAQVTGVSDVSSHFRLKLQESKTWKHRTSQIYWDYELCFDDMFYILKHQNSQSVFAIWKTLESSDVWRLKALWAIPRQSAEAKFKSPVAALESFSSLEAGDKLQQSSWPETFGINAPASMDISNTHDVAQNVVYCFRWSGAFLSHSLGKGAPRVANETVSTYSLRLQKTWHKKKINWEGEGHRKFRQHILRVWPSVSLRVLLIVAYFVSLLQHMICGILLFIALLLVFDLKKIRTWTCNFHCQKLII